MFDTRYFASYINNSKYMAGISMLLLNLGSKYIAMELSNTHEELLSNIIFRRFIIFTVIFISTRDIWVSFILTCIFIIFVSNVFNENSKYCLIAKPKNKFSRITKLDYQKAQQIIKLYELQQLNKS